MTLFSSPSIPSITPMFVASDSAGPHTAVHDVGLTNMAGSEGGAASSTSDDTVGLNTAELRDQFFAFQLSTQPDGPTLLEATQVEPAIEGGEENPDVLANVEMVSFHLASNEKIDPNTKATLRINIGKDE